MPPKSLKDFQKMIVNQSQFIIKSTALNIPVSHISIDHLSKISPTQTLSFYLPTLIYRQATCFILHIAQYLPMSYYNVVNKTDNHYNNLKVTPESRIHPLVCDKSK